MSSSSSPKMSTRDESPPFDNPDADIIIQTSDSVQFYTFKLLLSFSSPFFRSMFQLPQPALTAAEAADNQSNLISMIPVTESSEIMKPLLRYCYPKSTEDFVILNLDVAVGVLEAAKKYEMDGVLRVLEESLLALATKGQDPVHLYAIACRYNLEALARAAARRTLGMALQSYKPHPYLDLMAGSELQKLHNYHENYVLTVQKWLSKPSDWVLEDWVKCPSIGTICKSLFAWDIEKHFSELKKVFTGSLELQELDKRTLYPKCISCGVRDAEKVDKFTGMFHALLEEEIQSVKLDFK